MTEFYTQTSAKRLVLILASSLTNCRQHNNSNENAALYMNTIHFECYTNTRKITFLFEILKWNKCKQ